MNKKIIIAGNWKMNKTTSEGKSFIKDIEKMVPDIQCSKIIFFPAFTGLINIKTRFPFFIGAQNCHWEESGAFTGELSPQILESIGASFAIVSRDSGRLRP